MAIQLISTENKHRIFLSDNILKITLLFLKSLFFVLHLIQASKIDASLQMLAHENKSSPTPGYQYFFEPGIFLSSLWQRHRQQITRQLIEYFFGGAAHQA